MKPFARWSNSWPSGVKLQRRMLATEFGATVTAVTISEAQNRYANSLAPASVNPRYVLCDWLHHELPSASFDAAISIESSEHMPDKPAFFAQAARVLRPGGRLVICAWLSATQPSRNHARFLLEPICREGRMPSMGTEADYRAWISEAGLEFHSFEDLSRQVKKTWPICVRRFVAGLVRRPGYLRFLFNRGAHNRIFALTIARIWLAYEVGAMRYGIFVSCRPT
jgi:tocopherol O-methyltransferase